MLGPERLKSRDSDSQLWEPKRGEGAPHRRRAEGATAQWTEWSPGGQAGVAAGQCRAHDLEPEQGEDTHVDDRQGQEG